MKWLIAQGSSIHKVHVQCAECLKDQIWMRLYCQEPPEEGHYIALCKACANKLFK